MPRSMNLWRRAMPPSPPHLGKDIFERKDEAVLPRIPGKAPAVFVIPRRQLEYLGDRSW